MFLPCYALCVFKSESLTPRRGHSPLNYMSCDLPKTPRLLDDFALPLLSVYDYATSRTTQIAPSALDLTSMWFCDCDDDPTKKPGWPSWDKHLYAGGPGGDPVMPGSMGLPILTYGQIYPQGYSGPVDPQYAAQKEQIDGVSRSVRQMRGADMRNRMNGGCPSGRPPYVGPWPVQYNPYGEGAQGNNPYVDVQPPPQAAGGQMVYGGQHGGHGGYGQGGGHGGFGQGGAHGGYVDGGLPGLGG